MVSIHLLMLRKWMKIESPSLSLQVIRDYPAVPWIRERVARIIAQGNPNNDQHNACIRYVALRFFDRFISRDKKPFFKRKIVDYNIRVVAISCLFIAMKMADKSLDFEVFMQSHNTVAAQTSGPCEFLDGEKIKKVGRRILKVIGPLADCVNPLFYVTSLLSLLEEPENTNQGNVIKLIINSNKEIKLTRYAPSTIAAAATIMTVSTLTNEKYEKSMRIFTGRDIGMDEIKITECIKLMKAYYNGNKASSCKASNNISENEALSAIAEASIAIAEASSAIAEASSAIAKASSAIKEASASLDSRFHLVLMIADPI